MEDRSDSNLLDLDAAVSDDRKAQIHFGEEKEAMLRDAYGANYDRLVTLKTQYDPGNLVRMNLNIPRAPAQNN